MADETDGKVNIDFQEVLDDNKDFFELTMRFETPSQAFDSVRIQALMREFEQKVVAWGGHPTAQSIRSRRAVAYRG